MKTFLVVLLFGLSLMAAAPETIDTKETTKATVSKSGTGRSHNFEDLLVGGKYHFADEAVSTVEADKVFDSLIGVRTDFKDRLEESASNK